MIVMLRIGNSGNGYIEDRQDHDIPSHTINARRVILAYTRPHIIIISPLSQNPRTDKGRALPHTNSFRTEFTYARAHHLPNSHMIVLILIVHLVLDNTRSHINVRDTIIFCI